MFNKDFFPTPDEVIHLMIGNDNLSGKTVLEPSAGSGKIVDILNASGANVLACEKNEDLAKIVQSKAKFLKHDFLEVQAHEISHIHAIYMNPPFSADEKHILHAWNIAPSGCHVVALCNFQTLENDYSSYRKQLLSIVKDYGTSQNLGNVFSTAERTTGIEIGLINLYKPVSDNDFGDYFDSNEDDFEKQENGIMNYNAVREVVQRYVNAIKLYDEVVHNAIKMNDLVGTIGVEKITFICTGEKATISKQDFQKELQKKSWKWIFSKMNMEKFMTASLKADINKFVEQQEKVPFTMKNIYKMFELVIGTHGQRMDKVLVEIFDKLTSHYHENRYSVEGWKTNSHYLVNQKFILNDVFSTDKWYNSYPHVSYGCRNVELLDDLNKALCYITGANYNETTSIYKFFTERKDWKYENGVRVDFIINEAKEWGTWYDWDFFTIKAFKKGTIHCKFKDEKTWDLFNQAVAKIKGYLLPESIKKAA